MDKCKDNRDKALFYIEKTLKNNWSRAVLLNFLDTDLYERQGKAITNFSQTLPAIESDLAQAITRYPYNFDFLTIREKYDEKELKDALMDNIESLFMSLRQLHTHISQFYYSANLITLISGSSLHSPCFPIVGLAPSSENHTPVTG